MAVEGLRTAAPTAAPNSARGRSPAEAADGAGFGAALAACEREAPATVASEADPSADTALPAKDKEDAAATGTVANAAVAVEAPIGDAAWLAPSGGVPRLPNAAPAPPPELPPAPASARGVGSVRTADSGVAARTTTTQTLAASDAAPPATQPGATAVAAAAAADGATATPTAALLLQQQRIAQRDALAAAEPSVRQTAAALAPPRSGAELQALPGMGLLSAEAQGLPRRWERASAPAGPVAGTGPSSVVGSDASAPSPFMAPVDAASAAASLGHPGLAERMTEQVSWWMAQKTQGAELSMAIDGRPVSVSVKLQGNEAQVVFRSDQPEARQMLAQALPELKQMFGNEGLLLSQASVGSQARDPQGQGGQGARLPGERAPGAGQATTVEAIEVRPRVVALRADGSRPLDLYV